MNKVKMNKTEEQRATELSESIRPIRERILEQATSFQDLTREHYVSKLHSTGSAILVPRLETDGWRESAKLLDTLVLLYDKIYWDTPPNSLLIPECAEEHPNLHVFGVDEGFPDRFIEYMRQGIITPLVDQVGMYSLPVESAQEAEIPQHLIYTNLDILGWHRRPAILKSFATTARALVPPDQLTSLIDPYEPSQGSFAVVVRLLLSVAKAKALHADNIYVGNREEQLQWEILSGVFGEHFTSPPTDTLSLLRLFEGLLLAAPCRLSIDDVLQLREQVPARELRSWLIRRLERASDLLAVSDPVDHVLRDFDELVTETVSRSKKGMLFKLSFSTLAATLGAAIGGVPGAVVGSAAGYFAGEAANAASQAWNERYGSLGWVLNIHRYRERISK